MMKIPVVDGPKEERIKGIKNCHIVVFILIVLLSILTSNLLAKTEKTLSLSLKLEEWLILEVVSSNFNVYDIGHRQAQVETKIIPGEPVFIRAFISVGSGKKVILKAILLSPEKLESNSDFKWKWQGDGDLIGSGYITLDEPEILSIWPNNGFKSGTIIFENTGESPPFPVKGIFTLLCF